MMTTDSSAPSPVETPPAPLEPAVPQPTHGTLPESTFLEGFDRLLALALIVLGFGLASFAVKQSDIWIHLSTGRLIAQGNYEFGKDPFSYVGVDRPWINHSWLADLLTYLTYDKLGGRTVVYLKAGLAAVLTLLLLSIRRPGASLWPNVLGVGLAMLTAAPWLELQPLLLSLFFFVLTIFLLVRVPASRCSWRLPIFIGITFGLWANCDQWFILGPVVLALYAIGEFIGRRLHTAEDGDLNRPAIETFLYCLAVGVAACMFNPHHVRVWQLPIELIPGQMSIMLGKDPQFAPLFASLFDQSVLDFSGNAGGNPVNAFAFVLLFGLLVLSFVLNRSRFSWGLLLINVVLLTLAMVHARLLPFFAVVAGPTAALNLADVVAPLRQRSFTIGTVQLLTGGRIGIRVALLIAGLFALTACYPGWLQPLNQQRRLDWSFKPDANLVKAATTLQEWRASGQLPADARSLILSVDLANYCAWFAPGEKTFFDGRLGFHAPEVETFVKMRMNFATRQPGAPAPQAIDLAEFNLKYGITHLAFSTRDSLDFSDSLMTLLLARNRDVVPPVPIWELWDINGTVAILGWKRQQVLPAQQFEAFRFSAREQVFGSNVSPIPDAAIVLPLARLGLIEKYLVPLPVASSETGESKLLSKYEEYQLQRLQFMQQGNLRAQLSVAGSAILPFIRPRFNERMQKQLEDIQAAALGAIRSARKGIVDDPMSPDGYLALAQAYAGSGWEGASTESNQMIILSSLGRYFTRLRLDPSAGSPSETLAAASQVYQLHRESGRTDLTVEALKQATAAFRKLPVDPTNTKQATEALQSFDKEITERQNEIRRAEDLWLNSKNDPFLSLPQNERVIRFGPVQIPVNDATLARALLARRSGLVGKAIETLRTADVSMSSKMPFDQQVATVLQLGRLLIQSGQPEEAWLLFGEFEEMRIKEFNKPEFGVLRFAFLLIKVELLLVLGRFKELEEILQMQLDELRVITDSMSRQQEVIRAIALRIGRDAGRPHLPAFTEVLFKIHPRGYDGIIDFYASRHGDLTARLEDVQFRLALAYLEQGDNTAAAFHFRDFQKRAQFANQRTRLADEYLKIMTSP